MTIRLHESKTSRRGTRESCSIAFRTAPVTVEHSAESVFLGLGSNEGDRLSNLRASLGHLGAHPGITIGIVSSIYETEPVGGMPQAWFLNMVAECRVSLSPFELLRVVKRIERVMGRVAGSHWGPRIIDIDILLFGGAHLATPDLEVPHTELWNRAFVLAPLLDVLPPGTLWDRARQRLEHLSTGSVVHRWDPDAGTGL